MHYHYWLVYADSGKDRKRQITRSSRLSFVAAVNRAPEDQVIVGVLKLVDLSLTANLRGARQHSDPDPPDHHPGRLAGDRPRRRGRVGAPLAAVPSSWLQALYAAPEALPPDGTALSRRDGSGAGSGGKDHRLGPCYAALAQRGADEPSTARIHRRTWRRGGGMAACGARTAGRPRAAHRRARGGQRKRSRVQAFSPCTHSGACGLGLGRWRQRADCPSVARR
jgi:hypothetical protein